MNPSVEADDPMHWIDKFLPRYRTRFQPFDWPGEEDEWFTFVEMWVESFRRHKVTLGEANAAAIRLADFPPRYRNDHLPAVLEVVRQMRPGTNPVDATTAERLRRQREAAIRAAKADQLAAKWGELPAAERDRIRAEVIAENPGLAKFEPFVSQLCLARLQGVRA